MSLSLISLVKNLPKDKYFSQEFQGNQSELVEEKAIYLCDYMNCFKKFRKNHLRKYCYSLLEDKHT